MKFSQQINKVLLQDEVTDADLFRIPKNYKKGLIHMNRLMKSLKEKPKSSK